MYNKPISPSGMKLWKECPLRWHDTYILGNRQPSGAAALRGTGLHDALEAFYNGAPYPSGNRVLAQWQPFMGSLYEHSPRAEGEVAVASDWTRTAYNDPTAYFRGKMDLDIPAGDLLFIFDWKSGGIYPEHVDQGAAYCALSPGYDRYVVNFVYLDHPFHVERWTYTAAEVADVRAGITKIVEDIRHATEFPATPGNGCRWCPLSWRDGGDCKRAP